mmetsp:Transcript_18640/g.43735  ORF Transcript_18640/g.43735 Transcript_18640/m.43735 type:complete len:767 (-) Transcript_18640:51-2351(-)
MAIWIPHSSQTTCWRWRLMQAGGGVLSIASDLKFANCLVSNNTLATPYSSCEMNRGQGAGLALFQSTLVLQHTNVSHNSVLCVSQSSGGAGGGVSLQAGSRGTLESCVVSFNRALVGAGVTLDSSSLSLQQCVLDHNTGGALNVHGNSSLHVGAQTSFSWNTSPQGGQSSSVLHFDSEVATLHFAGQIVSGAGPAVVGSASTSRLNISLASAACGAGFLPVLGAIYHGHLSQAQVVTTTQGFSPMVFMTFAPVLEVTFSCTMCPPTQYSLVEAPYGSAVTCQSCPVGANCLAGGSNIVRIPGYWGLVDGSQSLRMYPCPSGYCQLVDNATMVRGVIEQLQSYTGGRTGRLCGGCASDAGNTLYSVSCRPAQECNDGWVVGVAALGSLGYFTFLVLQPMGGTAAVLKSISFFYQAIFFVTGPGLRRALASLSGAVVNFAHSFLSMSAAAHTSGFAGLCVWPRMSTIERVVLDMWLSALALITGVLFCCFLFSLRVAGVAAAAHPRLAPEALAAGWVRLALLMYSSAALTSAALVYCVEIDNLSYLFIDATVECPQLWQIAPGAVLLIVLVVPLAVFWVLKRSFSPSALDSKPASVPLRVLKTLTSSSYTPAFWWWDLTFIYRRLAIILLYAFIPSLITQFVLDAGLSLAFLMLALILRPFADPVSARVDVVVNAVLLATSVLSLPSAVVDVGLLQPTANLQEQLTACGVTQAVLFFLPLAALAVAYAPKGATVRSRLCKLWQQLLDSVQKTRKQSRAAEMQRIELFA